MAEKFRVRAPNEILERARRGYPHHLAIPAPHPHVAGGRPLGRKLPSDHSLPPPLFAHRSQPKSERSAERGRAANPGERAVKNGRIGAALEPAICIPKYPINGGIRGGRKRVKRRKCVWQVWQMCGRPSATRKTAWRFSYFHLWQVWRHFAVKVLRSCL